MSWISLSGRSALAITGRKKPSRAWRRDNSSIRPSATSDLPLIGSVAAIYRLFDIIAPGRAPHGVAVHMLVFDPIMEMSMTMRQVVLQQQVEISERIAHRAVECQRV